MARNVMKHIVHNWGSNILSIHDGIGPQFYIKPTGLFGESSEKTVTEIDVVGHLQREISRFCKFFYDYGRELSALLLH